MHYDGIAFAFQLLQQSPNVALALPDLPCRGLLCDQALLRLL
jgi:hypothetical protein